MHVYCPGEGIYSPKGKNSDRNKELDHHCFFRSLNPFTVDFYGAMTHQDNHVLVRVQLPGV